MERKAKSAKRIHHQTDDDDDMHLSRRQPNSPNKNSPTLRTKGSNRHIIATSNGSKQEEFHKANFKTPVISNKKIIKEKISKTNCYPPSSGPVADTTTAVRASPSSRNEKSKTTLNPAKKSSIPSYSTGIRRTKLKSEQNNRGAMQPGAVAQSTTGNPSLQNKKRKSAFDLEKKSKLPSYSTGRRTKPNSEQNRRGAMQPGAQRIPGIDAKEQDDDDDSIERTAPTKHHEDQIISIPNATLVQEEEDFDSRVQRMFQKAIVAVPVDPANAGQEERKVCAKRRIACLIVLLLMVIIIPSAYFFLKEGSTPTILPPTPAPTEFITESITLYMNLGDSSNIGFDLSCGEDADDVIERRKAPAFFNKPRSVATGVYHQVPVGRPCEVKITNMDGTGLKPGGFVRIHQGTGLEGTILLEMSGDDFTTEKSELFQVELLESQAPSESLVPSTQPTQHPSSLFTRPPFNFGEFEFRPPSPTRMPAPTPAPVTPSPTYKSLLVDIDILLDNFPIETGWNLTCGSNTIFNNVDVKADFPAESSYWEQGLNIIKSFDIRYDEFPCTFFIVDTAEDGICCSNGQGGYTITVVGDDGLSDSPTTLLSIANDGNFGAESHKTFECTYESCQVVDS